MKERDTIRDSLALREIQTALKAGRHEKAEELAARAAADGIPDPLPYYVRAQGWMRRGNVKQAVADLHEAVARAPRNVPLRNAVGSLLVTWQHPRDAIEVLLEAARLEPRSVETQFHLGWAYERAGELALCREAYGKALEFNPRHAESLARLAGVSWRQGEFEAAKDYADRALALTPTIYNALAARANVAVREKDFAHADEFVRRLLALEDISPIDHADALGIQGDLRDAEGRFPEAFDAYGAGNREKVRLYRPQFGKGKSFGDFATALAQYFETAQAGDWAGRRQSHSPTDGESPRVHAFLVGFARSGTTLLENILTVHPDVVTIVEEPTLNESFVRLFHDEKEIGRLKTIGGGEAEDARQAYWRRVRDCKSGFAGKVLVDDNPFYSLSLCLIAKLFPRAKTIFALRDPRDVVLSCFRRRIGVNRAIFELLSLDRAARFYDSTMRLRTQYREKLELDWLDLRHEALIADFDGEVTKLCDFLEMPFVPEMRAFAERARSRAIITASAAQISRGLSSEGVGHWRNYAEQLAPVMPILAPWVERFGYPLE